MISTPQLQQRIPFVDRAGLLSNEALRFLNDAFKALAKNTEEVATALANALAGIEAAAQAQADATAAANAAADAANAAAAAQGTADTAVQQHVGPAWAAMTGTESRATFSTYASPVISNPPAQVEVQALADAAQAISRAIKAVVDDLRANGALSS